MEEVVKQLLCHQHMHTHISWQIFVVSPCYNPSTRLMSSVVLGGSTPFPPTVRELYLSAFLPWNFLQSYGRLFSICSLGHIKKLTPKGTTLNHWSLTLVDEHFLSLSSGKTLQGAFYMIPQEVPVGMLLSCPQRRPARQCTFMSPSPPASYSLRSFTSLCLTISNYLYPRSQVLPTWELKDTSWIYHVFLKYVFIAIIFKRKIT